jgi:hypothetical protein
MILVSSTLIQAARHWLLGLSLTLSLAACGLVPGYTVTEGGEPVSVTGRLDGEILADDLSGMECVWLVGPSGRRTQLLLFDERMVVFGPLRLLDPSGTVIARAGDIVTVTGPSGGIGETICAAPGEDAFSVDVIEGPGGTYSFPTMPPF